MRSTVNNPKMFAAEFNQKIPHAHRKVDAGDIQLMTDCGLIARYGHYLRDDLQTVMAVLKYEHLQQNRLKRDAIRDSDGAIHCRLCGVLLEAERNGLRGRPKEYCQNCEASRSKDRQRKWRKKKQVVHVGGSKT